MSLASGSIAFTGFNADGNDNLAFVALTEITAGTTIHFQDNEWTGSSFNTGESAWTWTATGTIAAGAIVTIDNIGSGAVSANFGTVSFASASNRGIAASDEIVYAFVGSSATAPTTFLTAISNNGFVLGGGAGATLDGTGLVAGVDALDLSGVDAGADIAAYAGSRSGQATFSAYAMILNTATNWVAQDAAGDQSADGLAPDLPFSTAPFTVESGGQSVAFAAASASVSLNEGSSGATSFSFTVERTGGTDGDLAFQGAVSLGTASASDFTGGVAPTVFSGVIPAGATSALVTIEVAGDTAFEANETFSLSLTGGSNPLAPVTLGATIAASATIQNDDAAPPASVTILNEAASLQGATATPTATNAIELVRLGSIAATGGNAEVVAFDAASGRLFVLNASGAKVEVVQIGATGTLTKLAEWPLGALPEFGGANSLAVRNGVAALAYANADAALSGKVALFDLAGGLVKTIDVGVGPDQLTFTPDGLRILVANEGEPVSASVNPVGSISVIDMSGGAGAAAVAQTYGFESLNGQRAALTAQGVALSPLAGSVAEDVEPEYIAVSADGTRAYVTLQEVNAVAVLDLTDAAATAPLAILPLGSIDRNLPGNAFDASDRDGAINIRNWDVDSPLQPDAIATFTVGGATYFITANEGDARATAPFSSEEVRVGSGGYVLDPSNYPDEAALKANAALGRLTVNGLQGDTDGDGDIDQIVTYGGRGISIFRQEADGSITKVRETGQEFESILAARPDAGTYFNSENTPATFDTRSDNKGPEPEGVDVVTINGRIYAFVSLERAGGVMVYDVTDPANASFVTYRPPIAGVGSPDNAPEVIKAISAAESPMGVPLVVTANEVGNATTLYAAITPIYTIQGSGLVSGFVGSKVTTLGVVTAVDTGGSSRGFYIQDATGDGNASTSDGIFVFTGSNAAANPTVTVGQLVSVTGTVSEFLPSGAAPGSLSTTQINAAVAAGGVINGLGAGPAIAPVVIGGAGGLQLPTESIAAGVAAFESLEGMLVTVKEAVAVGPTNDFGEIFTVVDTDDDPSNGIGGATGLSDRGNLLLTPGAESFGATNTVGGDFNPERIQIDDDSGLLAGFFSPDVDTGARLGDVTGVVTYDFGNFQVTPTSPFVVDAPSTLSKETSTLVGDADHLLVASYNAENLDANDPAARFAQIAGEILSRMNAPDIVALQEIQDNDGTAGGVASTVTSAGLTLGKLIDALNAIAGPSGPRYAFLDNPFIGDDTNGGQAGGNIRNVFLYRTDRVDYVDGSLKTVAADGSAVTAAYLDQQTNNDNPFFSSRPPLVATFSFNGQEVTIVNNHWTSKGGSGALMGSIEPPLNAGEVQRAAQAQAVNNFVDSLLAADPDARIMVAGDLNEFPWEEPIQVLKGVAAVSGYDVPTGGDPIAANATYVPGGEQILFDLADDLPADEQFDYIFDGNSQTLDHMLVSASLKGRTAFDIVRINADFADQTSDHEPLLARINIEKPAFTLQLLHFSDAEAGLLAGAASTEARYGTAANLAALVDAFDDGYANTLILAGGDNYIPGPFLNAGTDPSVGLVHNKGTNPGAADIEIHNRIGVEASTIGNHEFDLGANVFADAVADAAFPYLSANLDFSGDAPTNARYRETVGVGGLEEASTLRGRIVPSAVVTEGGERIGLVGVTTQILEAISSTGGVEVKGFAGDGAETNDMALLAAQLQPVIDDLVSQGVNKIVLMSHLQQLGFEQALAPLLRGVDIVLAAGSNTRLGDADDVPVAFPGHAAAFAGTYPIVTAGADGKTMIIVNTDNEFTYLGRLVVDFDANGEILLDSISANTALNGAYAATDANVAAAWGVSTADLDSTAFAEGTKGEEVADITQAVQSVINAKDGAIFGFTDVYLEGERNIVRNQETNLGNLTADANADFADRALGDAPFLVSLKNAGGIRAQIGSVEVGSGAKIPPIANPGAGKPEGAISELDIENSLRFDNKLMVFDTTPAGLKAILEHGVAVLGNQGRFPQVGGVEFSYDPDLPAGSRIRDIALVDDGGAPIAFLYDEGRPIPNAPATFGIVTLSFLAQGGDGYPMKANGENFRFLLSDGALSDPLDEALDFTAAANVPAAALGEQQALEEFLTRVHGTEADAYDQADTPIQLDERIQNLNFRDGAVFDGAPTVGGSGSDVLLGTDGADDLRANLGRGGDDYLSAGFGDDILRGSRGDDTIVGGGGNDLMSGGHGGDEFAFFAQDVDDFDLDRLVDLSFGQGDVIRLEGFAAGFFADNSNPANAVTLLDGGRGVVIDSVADIRDLLDSMPSGLEVSRKGATDVLILSLSFTDAAGGHEQQIHLSKTWTQFENPLSVI